MQNVYDVVFIYANQGLKVYTAKNEKSDTYKILQNESGTKLLSARFPADLFVYLQDVAQREGLDQTKSLLLIVREHQRRAESPIILNVLAQLQQSVDKLQRTIDEKISEDIDEIKIDMMSIKETAFEHSKSINKIYEYISEMVIATNESDLTMSQNENQEQSDELNGNAYGNNEDDLQIISMQKPKKK